MATLWGVTDAQFLLVYMGLTQVAIGTRVLVPGRRADAHLFDLPNILFLLVVTTGLARLANAYFLERPVTLWVVVPIGSALAWFLSNYNRLLMLERWRFWLALMLAAGATSIGGAALWAEGTGDGYLEIVISNGILGWVLLGDGSGSGGGGDGDGGGGGE